jgi:hypothetical protein
VPGRRPSPRSVRAAVAAVVSLGALCISVEAAAASPGGELAYDGRTTSYTLTTTATSVIAGSSVAYDGTPVIAEFYAAQIGFNSEDAVTVALYEGSTDVATLCVIQAPTAASVPLTAPLDCKQRFTPSAGSHTYAVRLSDSNGTGASVFASTGTGGNLSPMFLRVSAADVVPDDDSSSAGVADSANLTWWGVWALVGLALVSLLAPMWHRAFGFEAKGV